MDRNIADWMFCERTIVYREKRLALIKLIYTMRIQFQGVQAKT
jgi:hypothetical protein